MHRRTLLNRIRHGLNNHKRRQFTPARSYGKGRDPQRLGLPVRRHQVK